MNTQDLKTIMEGNIESIVSYLLPNGKKKNNEWVVGSVNGEPGNSMMVRLSGGKAGVWSDFADSNSGGDLIDLWCQVKQISFMNALAEIKQFLGVQENEPKFYREKKKYIKPKKPQCTGPKNNLLDWFMKRGITARTISELKIAQQGNAILFPYLSPDGELELAKFRAMDEKKFWSNDKPIPCLFGWQTIDENCREVAICEGELDCLSYWEQGIPALSIPKGAGGGKKQDWIEYEYDRLERFEKIYISMDNDRAGQEAKAEIIDRLGRHRCLIIDLGKFKDANEVHLSGENLQPFLDRATTEDPEELRQLSEFHEEILKDLNCKVENSPGINLPWGKTIGEVKLRPGDTTVWGGINGHGKSLVLSQVIVDGVSQGERFCVASMEMPPPDFGNKMYRQIGFRFNMHENELAQIKEFVSDGIWLFNSYGTAKASKVLSVFDYARKRYGIKHFVIDSLAKCGFNEDDYNGQKEFVDALMEFALEHGVHVHLVCHVRKQGNEKEIPNKFSVKGTGAIIDMVANAFIIWRNKEKEERLQNDDHSMAGDPDMILDCVKQRKTGNEPRYLFWFHPHYCQFLEYKDAEPKQYIFD